jgi:glycosyltransferase involved in cell wall biosynthesis
VSLTLLEAMSVGLPIVATAVGGSPEIVIDGRTGWLVPPHHPERLAAAIVRMCHSRDQWQVMGCAARTRVEQNFGIRTTMARYEALYEQMLSHDD